MVVGNEQTIVDGFRVTTVYTIPKWKESLSK